MSQELVMNNHSVPSTGLPQYRIVLLNDNVNVFGDVIKAVSRIVHLDEGESAMRVKEAHFVGSSILTITHLELAELYQEMFMNCSPVIRTQIEEVVD